MSHFCQDHVRYFAKITFQQFKDSATNVLNRVKSKSLSEMFSTELKFTTDVLAKWFNDLFKSQFNELDAMFKTKMFKRKTDELVQ